MREVEAPMRASMISGAVQASRVHGVVLGHPETVEAERLDVLGEVDGVPQGLRRRGTVGDGGLIEHGETEWVAHSDWMSGRCVKTQSNGKCV